MSKKNGNRNASRLPRIDIQPETKNSILGILFFGLTVILLLAAFNLAGPAGRFMYEILGGLFGVGYYLLPVVSLIIAIVLFFAHQRRVSGATFLGAALLIAFGLGFIDIISAGQGGYVGIGVGSLELLFGRVASLVISVIGAAASLILMLNASIKLQPNEKEKEAEEREEINGRPTIELKLPPEAEDHPSKKSREEKNNERESSKDEAEEEVKIADLIRPRSGTALKVPKATNYVPPPLDLLRSATEKPQAGDLRANANIIKRTLESFGIAVEMGEINIGPKVTRYTLKPAEGVKLSRILALNPDLSLSLAAHPIRIEAPIPGKSLVGIEVPNKSAAIVRLGSMLAYPEFTNSGALSFILGRDVTGEPIAGDIEKMPHMLIAGATGSGKSVGIHSLIVSLLYKNSPDALRLILIDPKRVELSVYNGIPHLVTPVITEGKKAIGVFRWAIQEMEHRYEILLGAGARDIKSYNKSRVATDGPMSYIVIIVDELADLMAAYGREIESSIVRLAQMARATGIHLVVATQRPSVEVITGLIKANITARVALQVASQIDSRTILDMAGAEKLLGGGDMLFISPEYSKPKRIQGAYISEEEIKKVSEFISSHNALVETTDISVKGDGSSIQIEEMGNTDGEDDEMYEEAVQVVIEAKKASASLLQRRLKVGYARAARLLDIMETNGIIGPGEGAKPREVFMEKMGADINPDDTNIT